MQEIKLNLEVTSVPPKDIAPEAGMVIDFDFGKRLIVKKLNGHYAAVSLGSMDESDSTETGPLECLKATRNSKVIGKLTL